MPLKILLTHDWCCLGGHTSWMADLSQGLRDEGHDVRCFFFEGGPYVSIFAERCPTLIGDWQALQQLVRRERFDIVHGEAGMQDLSAILARAGFAGKLVLTRQGVDAPLGWHSGNCDGYVAITRSFSELMQECTDLPVPVVPNGIDTEFFRQRPVSPPEKRVIGWCARSRDQFKNVRRFVEVTRLLDPEKYEFWVADGDTQVGIDEYRRSLGAEHIRSWRQYPEEELPEFYSAIARSGGCFLHTASLETQGIVLVEALASECPVIAARVPGVRDVMCGERDQWLFSESDSDAAVAAFIERALPELHTPDWLSRLRRHAVDAYSREVMVAGYLQVYEDALRGARRREDAPAPEVIAANLWTYAAELVAGEGRARDALFAIHSALAMDPHSGTSTERQHLVAKCSRLTRAAGAADSLRRARDAFQRKEMAQGLRLLARSARAYVQTAPAAGPKLAGSAAGGRGE